MDIITLLEILQNKLSNAKRFMQQARLLDSFDSTGNPPDAEFETRIYKSTVLNRGEIITNTDD